MTLEEARANAAQLKADAEELLDKFEIKRHLSPLGVVELRGSVLYDLMVRYDLDFNIYSDVYAGMVTWGGETHEGIHDPLVSMETFRKVQRIFREHDKAGPRIGIHTTELNGSLVCSTCGSKLSVTLANTRSPLGLSWHTRTVVRKLSALVARTGFEPVL